MVLGGTPASSSVMPWALLLLSGGLRLPGCPRGADLGGKVAVRRKPSSERAGPMMTMSMDDVTFSKVSLLRLARLPP
jgi:hypothetical protein